GASRRGAGRMRGGRRRLRLADRAACPFFDSRALHAVDAAHVSLALPSLRRALRQARVCAQVVPAGRRRALRPPAPAPWSRALGAPPGSPPARGTTRLGRLSHDRGLTPVMSLQASPRLVRGPRIGGGKRSLSA